MINIDKINLELSILNDKLQIFGMTKCKEYKNKKCYFFKDAGGSFFSPNKCNLDNCPLINKE